MFRFSQTHLGLVNRSISERLGLVKANLRRNCQGENQCVKIRGPSAERRRESRRRTDICQRSASLGCQRPGERPLFPAAQDQLRHFGSAIVAEGMLAAQAPADVQHGGRLVEETAIVATAVTAGYQDRSNQRKTDLASVIVAGKHEVDAVSPGPGHIVRRVTQTKAKCILGILAQARVRGGAMATRCRRQEAAGRERQFVGRR